LNGTDIASFSPSLTSPNLDTILNVTTSTTNTLNVDVVVASGYSLTITEVALIFGWPLTSTTATSLLTITLDTAGKDSYILKVNGNFVYMMGVRWWVKGNRKTTATASFSSTLANQWQSQAYNAGAGDDGDNNAFIVIKTGDYPGDNASFTISGNVGATGDTIIITGIYAQVLLRGNNPDSLKICNIWFLLVREKGFVSWTQELLSIDGGKYSNQVNIVTKNGYKFVFSSSEGTDVISSLSFSANDSPETTPHIAYSDDFWQKVFCVYLNVVVLGV
jgi:hypothetical protein